MSNQLHLLKSKRFLPLFVTQFCSAFNDNAFKNAILIWFAYDVAASTGFNAPKMIALAAGLFILPFVLLSPIAGQIADKYEQSRLTRMLKVFELLLMCAAPIFFHLQSVLGLLLILFLLGLQATLFGPIKYSLLPEHLKEDELIGGNGLIEGGTFLSILLGTLFGGLIIRTDSGVLVLSSFLIAMAFVGLMSSWYIPKSTISDRNLSISWNILAETRRLISYSWKEPTVGLSILGISWFWLVGITLLTQFPVYVKDVIVGNESIVTLLLAIFSIGIGTGSLLCNKLLKSKIDGRLVPWGAIGISIFMIDFWLASRSYVPSNASELIGIADFLRGPFCNIRILIDLFLLAVCSGFYTVPLYAIMQHRSNKQYLARIIATNNLFNALFMIAASCLAFVLFHLSFTVMDIILVVSVANFGVYFIVRGVVRKRLKNA